MRKVYFLQPSSTRDGLWMDKAILDLDNKMNLDILMTIFVSDYYLDGVFRNIVKIDKKDMRITFQYVDVCGDLETASVEYMAFDLV